MDEHLRVVGSQGTIYCLGDAAVTGTTPQTTLPPTAQVAKQQGVYMANLLNRNKLALRPAYSAWCAFCGVAALAWTAAAGLLHFLPMPPRLRCGMLRAQRDQTCHASPPPLQAWPFLMALA